ncbi:MAG TPA: DUF2268 domain-containing putative Zn-dependent protease [bacterium]|nr:DUF2268 domain-containing putative Zn-dependent protease [bacterium]HPN44408.1 DUF2268 domain-containing putative Zn-dependent protease [bacterium]
MLIILNQCNNPQAGKKSVDYIIPKENGRIILAYKAFEDFLNTDRSWENYQHLLLEKYPEIQYLHNRQLEWGAIDSLKFPQELKNYDKIANAHYFTQYDEKSLIDLYDSVIKNAHQVLPPVNSKPVDLCLFFPYGSCFVEPGREKYTIYISLYINPADVKKIMIHEYAHCLHIQRRPAEPLTLRREVVSEGMAVYITTLVDTGLTIKNAIPFMPAGSVEWCLANEQTIKDSILVELEHSDESIFRRYISDGDYAAPPPGFVQKTAYFAGYRIIAACIAKGMSLEEVCALDSQTVIEKSGYFTKNL